MNEDFTRTRKCVNYLRKIGLCPLPSRMDRKGPMLNTFSEHYGPTPVPEFVYDSMQTTNIQIITGTKSPTKNKILVVDCDGPEALPVWREICEKHSYKPERIWISRTGSGGWHFYFSLSSSTTECRSGMIWGIWDTWGDEGKGKWVKHKEVRILADNALVIAPPSIHIDTGDRYEFDPSANPKRFLLPAPAPDWLLGMTRLGTLRFHGDEPKQEPRPVIEYKGEFYRREDVLNAIGDDKFRIATSEWGLKTPFGAPNANGWVQCFVPGREDPRHSKPSGSFNWKDGTLQDRKDLTTISFFDLGVVLGQYAKWQDCRDDLGSRYIGKRCKDASYPHSY
jgi:hypothetical protein